jgi:hypothetical protein
MKLMLHVFPISHIAAFLSLETFSTPSACPVLQEHVQENAQTLDPLHIPTNDLKNTVLVLKATNHISLSFHLFTR